MFSIGLCSSTSSLAQPLPLFFMPCCLAHHRLDLIRHADDYQDTPCGTPRPVRQKPDDGKRDYCCFECPVLHGTEPTPDPNRLRRYE